MKNLLLLVLGLSSLNAIACSCNYQELEDSFENNRFVSYAKVISVSENGATKSYFDQVKGDLEILKLYKGDSNAKPILVGSKTTSDASCNVKLEVGEYIVFTNDNLVALNECSPTMKLIRYNAEYRDYALLLLEHLSKKSKGQRSDFKPKLTYKEVSEIFKKHRTKINNLFFKNPLNKNIVGRYVLSADVYIDKNGYVTKFEIPERYNIDETIRKLIENYIKTIKFRESYENYKFGISISKFE